MSLTFNTASIPFNEQQSKGTFIASDWRKPDVIVATVFIKNLTEALIFFNALGLDEGHYIITKDLDGETQRCATFLVQNMIDGTLVEV